MSKIVKQGQSFLDKCLQQTGSIENALESALLNDKSITSELAVGEKIESVGITNKRVVDHYTHNDEPATNATIEVLEELDDLGIGSMAIGSTFIVR